MNWNNILGYLKRLASATPVFGNAARNLAGRAGLRIADTYGRPFIYPWERAILGAPDPASIMRRVQSVGQDAGNAFRGLVLNPTNINVRTPAAQVIGQPAQKYVNKFHEAKLMERLGFGPKTERLLDIVKAMQLDPKNPEFATQLRNELRQRFGGNYIVKDIAGAGSLRLPTEKNQSPLIANLPLHKMFVQQRMPLGEQSGLHTGLDQLFRMTGAVTQKDAPNLWARGGKLEYRVPTLAGKVVPFGSLGRGGVAQSVLPWYGMRNYEAEKFVQRVLNKLPANMRRTSYGMDIGFTTEGKPFVIEMNPADRMTGYSAFASAPTSLEAHRAAVMGELPAHIKRQLWLMGGLGATGLAGAGYGAANMLQKQSVAVTPLDRAKQYFS